MKKLVVIVLAIAMVFGMAACSSGETAKESASTEASTEVSSAETTETVSAENSETVEFPEMTLTFQIGSSDTTPESKGIQMMKEYIEEATDGKVKVEIYYNYSLFTQDQELTAIMAGNLDMNITNSGALGEYMPALNMFGAAYFFKNLEHVQTFFDSDVADELFDEVATETGIRVLGFYSSGARCVNLTIDKKVTSRADLADVKIRMPNNVSYLFMGTALGANPIGMAGGDVYVALQTEAIDGQDNPLATTIDYCWYEVEKSITLTNHVIQNLWIAINEAKWQTLSPELQEIINEAVSEGCTYATETYSSSLQDNITYLEEQGLTIYELTDEEMAAYQQEVTDYYNNDPDIKADWDMDLYQAIQDLAE